MTVSKLASVSATGSSGAEAIDLYREHRPDVLLMDIRMSVHAEVSVTGLIRQNRKAVAVFVLVGVLVIAAIPFLLKARPPETEDTREAYIAAETPEPTPTPFFPKQYTLTRDDRPINLEFLPYLVAGFALSALAVVAVGFVYLIYMLITSIDRRKKHADRKSTRLNSSH
mgnify:CR=1 FL=1